jgi:nucleoside-diphosphate-sugar epimerase
MRFSGERVVVTGGAGLIGGHVVDHLIEAGAELSSDDVKVGMRMNLSEVLRGARRRCRHDEPKTRRRPTTSGGPKSVRRVAPRRYRTRSTRPLAFGSL